MVNRSRRLGGGGSIHSREDGPPVQLRLTDSDQAGVYALIRHSPLTPLLLRKSTVVQSSILRRHMGVHSQPGGSIHPRVDGPPPGPNTLG